MTSEEQARLNAFEGSVAEQQGVVADLVNQSAPVARVQQELSKLKQMAPTVDAESPLLDKLKVVLVRQAVFQLKFQYGEQSAGAAELIRGADKTSDAADLDSWDYADEDGIPPADYVDPAKKKTARLAAFRKQRQ